VVTGATVTVRILARPLSAVPEVLSMTRPAHGTPR
jgi:hypothetical protein